jgi:hypothetical protein
MNEQLSADKQAFLDIIYGLSPLQQKFMYIVTERVIKGKIDLANPATQLKFYSIMQFLALCEPGKAPRAV